MRLRNYIIHNNMPFTHIVSSIHDNCKLYISKTQLLEWSGWSTVKKDIEALPNEDIEILPLLSDIGSSLYAVYLQSLYYLAPIIIDSIKNIECFMKKHNVKYFDFVEYEREEEIKDGTFVFHPVPFKGLLECIDQLNSHPSIDINSKPVNL